MDRRAPLRGSLHFRDLQRIVQVAGTLGATTTAASCRVVSAPAATIGGTSVARIGSRGRIAAVVRRSAATAVAREPVSSPRRQAKRLEMTVRLRQTSFALLALVVALAL